MSVKLVIEKFHFNLDIKYETELTKEGVGDWERSNYSSMGNNVCKNFDM